MSEQRPRPTPCQGGCFCGAIRYDLRADPLTLYACHCTDCQRHFGTAFGLSMIVARDAIEMVQGSPAVYELSLEDGRTKRGRFCDRCGTRLWGEPVLVPRVISLRPGTLDQRSWFEPVGHIWVSSALRWVSIPAGTLRYERQPEDMRELIRAWKAARSFS
jgi:hypothetical protein